MLPLGKGNTITNSSLYVLINSLGCTVSKKKVETSFKSSRKGYQCDIICGIYLLFCFLPDYGGSSTMKYQTYNPNYSSKSYVYSGSRTMVSTTSWSHCFSVYSHLSQKYCIDHVMCHLIGVLIPQTLSLTLCWCHSGSPRTQHVWYFTVHCDEISSRFSSPRSRFLHFSDSTARHWLCATDVWAPSLRETWSCILDSIMIL